MGGGCQGVGTRGWRGRGRSCNVSSLTSNSGASRRKTAAGKTVVGILGEPVTLPLEFRATRATKNVVWVFNTSGSSQERRGAATADSRRKPKGSEERRVRTSDQDQSLKISQLKMEDAGPYHAYVCSEASRDPSVRHFTLLVYSEYPLPASSLSQLVSSHRGTQEGNIRTSG